MPGQKSRQMLFEADTSSISIVCWQEVVVRIKKLVLFLLRANWLGGCFGALWMWYVGSSWTEKKEWISMWISEISVYSMLITLLPLLPLCKDAANHVWWLQAKIWQAFLYSASLTYVLHIQALCSLFKIQKVKFCSQMAAHNSHYPDFNLTLV